jgi:hypothetical protein
VIDELMGHEATGRSRQQQGSAMGAHYRHITPEMAARVIDAGELPEPVNAQGVLTSTFATSLGSTLGPLRTG